MTRAAIVLRLSTLAFIGGLAGLVSCTPPTGSETPPTLNSTQAYQTVEARLTEAVALTPVLTDAPYPVETGTPTASATASATPSPTVAPPTPTFTATPPCDLAAAGNPIDITIPDDSPVEPGQNFTKIWRLQNVGTCTWTEEYTAVWFSGEMLSAPSSVRLSNTVAPGGVLEISVDMIAPRTPGTYQSNWKMRNAAGILFGIGPSGESPFWVRIRVVEPPTGTPQASPQPTLTPTAAATPQVLVSGLVSLAPGDLIDLDSLLVNGGSGDDLLYQVNDSANVLLTPQGGGLVGVFGSESPSFQDCQAAGLSNASLPVESLSTGTYICYRTGQGHYGWARLTALDMQSFELSAELLTWAAQDG